ncbi:unnamed protein product [Calypogeia fissa]
MASLVASSPPLFRSTFWAPSSAFTKPVKSCHFPQRPRDQVFRKCRSQISSGLGPELHDAIVQLQAGLMQKAATVGLPLPVHDGALNWLGVAVPAALWYVAAKPGSLSGVLDYAYAPMHSLSNTTFNADEVQVGMQIGEGSFGIVYEGYIGRGVRKGSQKKELHVILKKVRPHSKGAEEMHDAEIHMNRRVQRTAPNACADFLGTTKVSASQSHGRLTEGLWLVWRYQGDRTLAHYMKQKNFPENVAEFVLESKAKSTSKRDVTEQNNAVIRKIATQILTNLRDLHRTGLVHRDVKPLNLVLAQDSGEFKLVDLGAAVDLRSGYNYVPDETIIDPTYAAPEHHVMPVCTPQLPPDPLCSVVSPLVWLLNTPDRFDLYSAGLILLQMAVRPLRQDIGLQQFNTEFKRAGYNLDTWRKRCRFGDEEFSLLDGDGGAGWELVRSMLLPRHDRASFIWPSLGSSRPSAEAALRHRFLGGSLAKLPSFTAPKLPKISIPSISIPSISIPSISVPQISLPELSLPAIPVLVSSVPRQPSNVMPNASFDSIPKPKARATGLAMDWGKVSTKISSILPTATTGALTLAAGWLVFSALRDSAEKSYAVGQSAMELLGTFGPVSFVSFLLVRLWFEAQEEKQMKTRTDVNLAEAQIPSLAAVDVRTHIENMTTHDMPVSHHLEHHLRESFPFAEVNETEETRHHIGLLAAADVETLHEATIRKLLSSRPRTMKYSPSGLTEAVQTMELQLASLESSIAAGRHFSLQQQEQIIQMEKLLNHRPRETVGASKESSE